MVRINKQFPARDALNEALEILQDQITRITAEEEQEMLQEDLNKKGNL